VAVTVLVLLAVLLYVPDREIDRQRRLCFIQLHTFLGDQAPGTGSSEPEFRRAADAARYPAEAEGALRALALVSRGRGDAAAASRYEALAAGLLDDWELRRLEEMRDDPDALWAIGRHWMLRGEMPRAADTLARAAGLAPDDPDILLSRALAAFESGKSGPGVVAAWTEEALRSGLRFSPNAATGYRLAARCYERLGRHDSAEASLRDAARFDALLR